MPTKTPQSDGRKLKSRYTEAAALRICEAIANGSSMRAAAKLEGVTHRTVLDWAKTHEKFGTQYAQALRDRLDYLEDRLIDLCKLAHVVARDEKTGGAQVAAVRLEIDTLKWYLCKLVPRKFGDRQAVELTGKDGASLIPAPTDAQLNAFAAKVAAVRQKLEA